MLSCTVTYEIKWVPVYPGSRTRKYWNRRTHLQLSLIVSQLCGRHHFHSNNPPFISRAVSKRSNLKTGIGASTKSWKGRLQKWARADMIGTKSVIWPSVTRIEKYNKPLSARLDHRHRDHHKWTNSAGQDCSDQQRKRWLVSRSTPINNITLCGAGIQRIRSNFQTPYQLRNGSLVPSHHEDRTSRLRYPASLLLLFPGRNSYHCRSKCTTGMKCGKRNMIENTPGRTTSTVSTIKKVFLQSPWWVHKVIRPTRWLDRLNPYAQSGRGSED